MNYTTQHEAPVQMAKAEVNHANEVLDLFAEELPIQHDLKAPDCFGCIATVGSTGGGSTFSSLSSVSSL